VAKITMTASNNHNQKPLNTAQKKELIDFFEYVVQTINQHSYLQVLMCLHDAH